MAYKLLIGIYKIENKVNGKVYIGQSTRIKKRFWEHKRKLILNKHTNIYLQNAWNKYGEENFIFNILEICNIEELDEKEIFYIEKYNSLDRNYGYNIEHGGCITKTMSEETRRKISLANKNPSQETRDKISRGNTGKRHGETKGTYSNEEIKFICFLLEQGMSPSKISREYGFNKSTVLDIKNSRVWTYISKDYSFNNIDSFKDIKRPVVQYDLNFNKIAEFESIDEASKITKISTSSIGKSCRNEQKITNNFVWFYYGEDTFENIQIKKEYIIKKDTILHFKKKINQFDLEGNLIKSWDSIRETSRELNLDNSLISKVCRGKQKTTGGFIFKFV